MNTTNVTHLPPRVPAWAQSTEVDEDDGSPVSIHKAVFTHKYTTVTVSQWVRHPEGKRPVTEDAEIRIDGLEEVVIVPCREVDVLLSAIAAAREKIDA